MPESAAYNSIVAARTRAAVQILGNKDLLAAFLEAGGLQKDLEEIRDFGNEAEAYSTARVGAKAKGGGVTVEILRSFATLQHDYKGIMAVVQAVKGDLEEAKAPAAVIQAMAKILVNEAEVALRSEQDTAAAGGKAKGKREAKAKLTQEAIRAEIARDAGALLAEKGAHAALKARRVTDKRLQDLKSGADSLAGKLGERVLVKATGKDVTAAQRDAVLSQRRVWAKVYRILSRVGRKDSGFAGLLKEASRKG